MFNYRLWLFEASVIMTIIVGVLVLNGNVYHFDNVYGSFIQGFRSPSLNTFMELITYIGNWQSITIICILLLAMEKTRKKFGIPVTAVAIFSSVANKLVKIFMERPRPDASNMLISEDGFSFTSGHTTTAIAVALLIGYILVKNSNNKKRDIPLSIFLFALAFIIGISRVYLGVHYASDVFAGIFMGTGSMALISLFFYPYKKELLRWKTKFHEKIDKLDTLDAEIVEIDENNK